MLLKLELISKAGNSLTGEEGLMELEEGEVVLVGGRLGRTGEGREATSAKEKAEVQTLFNLILIASLKETLFTTIIFLISF